MARHFLSQEDFSRDEMDRIFEKCRSLKKSPISQALAQHTLVMFFEKSSTRTRLSFEIGATQLGAHAVYVDTQSSQLARGESLYDTAAVVSRYADLMMARVYSHGTLLDLAEGSTIPVINGLSDEEHPCQSMADLFTIVERKGTLDGLRIAYVGDGNNNVAHSLMLGAALAGASVTVACPWELQPAQLYVERARAIGAGTGSKVDVTQDPQEAAQSADVIYTDVWVSMGREAEADARLEQLRPYQVNERLMAHAAHNAIFMHCLPMHPGDEVTAEVAYGPQSVIFDQAENRLHVQKAIMLFLTHEGKEINESRAN